MTTRGWRPENWDKEIEKLLEASPLPELLLKTWRAGIEAGADAILKALLKDGVYDIAKITETDVIIKLKEIIKRTYRRGAWVFIEEE